MPNRQKPKVAADKRKGRGRDTIREIAAPVDQSEDRRNTADETWFRARMAETGVNQADCARILEMEDAVFNRVLKGTRRVQPHEAVTLARVFRVPLDEMLARCNAGAASGVPASGRVLPDGRVSSAIDQSIQPPSTPPSLPVGAVALVVEARQGPLAPWDGALVVYQPSKASAVGPEAVGRLCVIEDLDMPLPVIGVIHQAAGTRETRVSVFGTGEDMPARRLVRASFVLAIHMPAPPPANAVR